MTLPFALANSLNIGVTDPNRIILGRSYYYIDASPDFAIGSVDSGMIQVDEAAVAGQIEIVIGTPLGTEPFEMTFGSNVMNYVFENTSEYAGLELEILTALRKWLGGRLDFFSVTVASDEETGDTFVAIPYRIKIAGASTNTYVGNLSAIKRSI